jgi:murein DD-endopeptidase MepM/ murein hydrolase activator NlpD
MKGIFHFTFLGTMLLLLSSCQSLPKEKYSQFVMEASYEFSKGQLLLSVNNPLHCPIRVYTSSKENAVDSILQRHNPIVISAKYDTVKVYNVPDGIESDVSFRIVLGDSNREIEKAPVAYPFPKGKSYEIIQGNNSKPTHNSNYSRYAVDFGLSINDTICAATDGFVVGVIEEYKHGGKGQKWRPFSNFITIYDPASGIITQYVHLTHNGSFVEVGDEVRMGQAIGLSGMTGQTNVQHLHFNYLIPAETIDGIQSTPFVLFDGTKSTSLRRGNMVKNPK